MSNKITSQDIFDDKVFDKIKTDANAFKVTLEGLKKEFTGILQQQQAFLQQKVSFGSAEDLKKLNAVLEENKALRKSLLAIRDQLDKLSKKEASTTKILTKEKVKEAEQRKRNRKDLVDEIALENKQVLTLNQLLAINRKIRRERADLNLKTAEGRQRLKEINVQLDKNNKLIRQNADAMKKQRLNVGNYTGAIGRAVGKLRNLAGAFGLVAGAAGVVSVFRNAVKIFRDFEQAQTDLASISGATTDEMERLSTAAKDLGATTFFTATEVSGLQVELAKLGFTAEQIEGSTEGILNLAAAFGTDLARAAKIAAGTLNGFGLATGDAAEVAEQTARVTDVMANAFSNSALDLEKFEVSISKVAPIAASLGVDIETTTAVLGQLANANFDASTAGTQFRNVLLKLSNPSSELANTLGFTVNSSDDLVKSLRNLNAENLQVAETQQLIDVRSVAILQNLADNVEGVEKLIEANRRQNTAFEIASKQLKTLDGSYRLLSSAYEGFVLSVEDGTGSIAEALRNINQLFIGVFNLLTGTKKAKEGFEALDPAIQEVARKIVALFNALKTVVSTLIEYGKVLFASVVAIRVFRLATALATSSVGKYVASLFAAEAATIGFSTATKGATFSVKALNAALKKNIFGLIASALAFLLVLFSDWIIELVSSTDAVEDLSEEAKDAANGIEKMGAEMKKFANASEVFSSALGRSRRDLLTFSDGRLQSALDVATKKVAELSRELVNNNKLSEEERKGIEKRIELGKEIIDTLSDEIAERDKFREGVKTETGLINVLTEEIRKLRGQRDRATSEGEIEGLNKTIKLREEELKRLKELGLANKKAEEFAKKKASVESKLAKLRIDLNKLLIKSNDDVAKSIDRIAKASRQEGIFKAIEDLEELQKSADRFAEFLGTDNAITKFNGTFRNIITKEDLNEFRDKLDEQETILRKSLDDKFDLIDEDNLRTKEAAEAALEDEKKLRDADIAKRKLAAIKAIEDSEKFDGLSAEAAAKRRSEIGEQFNELELNSAALLNTDKLALQNEYNLKVEQNDKARINAIEANEEAFIDKSIALNEKYYDDLLDLQTHYIGELEDLSQQILDITAARIAKEEELEIAALERDADRKEKSADRQFQRAIRGQANTFKFQEEQAAAARKRELEAQQEAGKKEKAIRLASAYFAALEVRFAEAAVNENLEKKGGKTARKSLVNANTAPLFALKDALLAEGLKPFYHGTEDTGKAGFARDQYGAITGYTHEKERVLTAKDNAVIGDMSNSELTNLAFKYNSGLLMDVGSGVKLPSSSKAKDNTNYKLLKELKALRDDNNSRPVQHVDVDSLGNIREIIYAKGMKTAINHKAKSRL